MKSVSSGSRSSTRRRDGLGIRRVEDAQRRASPGRAEGPVAGRPARGCCRPSRRRRRPRSPRRGRLAEALEAGDPASRSASGASSQPSRFAMASCDPLIGRPEAGVTLEQTRPPSLRPRTARRPPRCGRALAGANRGRGRSSLRIGHRCLRASSRSMVRPPIRSGRGRCRRCGRRPDRRCSATGVRRPVRGGPDERRDPSAQASRTTRRATSVTRSTVKPNSSKMFRPAPMRRNGRCR